jgi:hypothetical protein
MKQKLLYTLMFGSVVVLTACGGGGGGGGGSSPYSPGNPYLRTEVPYATPVRVATVDPLVNDAGAYAVTDTFVANISGTGQDVIVAGRSTATSSPGDWVNSRLSLFSWSDGTLVDRTAQWFPGGINVITGTEPSLQFADWFNTGRTGMFVAPSTDGSTTTSPAYVYTNNGSSFSRQAVGPSGIWAHGSAVADLDNDGFKDIIILDSNNGANTTLAINNRINSFNTYTDRAAGSAILGGNAVAAADFLNNGTTTIITTDNWSAAGHVQKLYSWSIDGSNKLNFTELGTLPTSRFNLPKWQAIGILDSHNVQISAHDFNSDNAMDAIVFSQPGRVTAGTSTDYSEIQFLKNNGSGTFTDVTDTTLVGYNTNTRTTYQPKFLDLNGDGLTDILVSGGDNSGASTQFLLKSGDGKFVAAYQNIMTDFLAQTKTMLGSDNNGNTVNLVRAPNNKLYLVSALSFMNGSDRQLALYMSELGTQRTTTAQSAVNLILQKWPYMTVAQANDMLARTSATYFGGRVLDLDAVMNPIGALSLSTGRGMVPINGFIAGVNLDSGSAVVMDSMNRSFNMNLQPMNITRLNSFQMNMEHNDQHNLSSHAEYLVNGPVNTYNGVRVGSESRYNAAGQNGQGTAVVNQQYTNYTVGIPKIWSRGGLSFGTQYTALNQNPWLSMGGAWGQVTNSNILDNVVTYRSGGFSTQASFMHVTTNITPGLVTNVSNMTGGWAETGYRYTDWKGIGDVGVYAGVKPVVFSGSVDAKIPTAIDNAGNIVYTSKNMAIQNQTTTYVRAMYANMLDRNTQYRLSGMVLSTGQYRIMHELRWNLN